MSKGVCCKFMRLIKQNSSTSSLVIPNILMHGCGRNELSRQVGIFISRLKHVDKHACPCVFAARTALGTVACLYIPGVTAADVGVVADANGKIYAFSSPPQIVNLVCSISYAQ
ncbi:unnamed protein product [Ceratitis capitata]|uniref:(Mediterranean fruit fly) hypothetical protein n=1 Tax=Ceratitis capitata TaxID=7213 RepID=A0A811UA07_CERCA|nr:unnamed protein product [Ceratitis capitata]